MGFAGASDQQFGSRISVNQNCHDRFSEEQTSPLGLNYRVGIWSANKRKESSNYKELCNLVESTKVEAAKGRLSDCEYFLFTDKSTAESSYYRGSSSSVLLHNLVLHLRLLEMKYNMLIHIMHCAGMCMIAQGTDGCSWESLVEGVMAGLDMLSSGDLAKTALERHPPLLNWI